MEWLLGCDCITAEYEGNEYGYDLEYEYRFVYTDDGRKELDQLPLPLENSLKTALKECYK